MRVLGVHVHRAHRLSVQRAGESGAGFTRTATLACFAAANTFNTAYPATVPDPADPANATKAHSLS